MEMMKKWLKRWMERLKRGICEAYALEHFLLGGLIKWNPYRPIKPSCTLWCMRDSDNWPCSGSCRALFCKSLWMKSLLHYECEMSLMLEKNFLQLMKWLLWNEVCTLSGQSNYDAGNCTWIHAPKGHTQTHTTNTHTTHNLQYAWFQQKVVTSGIVPLSPCWTPHPVRKLVLPSHTHISISVSIKERERMAVKHHRL